MLHLLGRHHDPAGLGGNGLIVRALRLAARPRRPPWRGKWRRRGVTRSFHRKLVLLTRVRRESRSASVIAYNLGNLLRRLVLPVAIQSWSLTSLQQRLFKTGGRLIRHARYFTLQLAESYLTRPLFRQIVARIERLAWHPT